MDCSPGREDAAEAAAAALVTARDGDRIGGGGGGGGGRGEGKAIVEIWCEGAEGGGVWVTVCTLRENTKPIMIFWSML